MDSALRFMSFTYFSQRLPGRFAILCTVTLSTGPFSEVILTSESLGNVNYIPIKLWRHLQLDFDSPETPLQKLVVTPQNSFFLSITSNRNSRVCFVLHGAVSSGCYCTHCIPCCVSAPGWGGGRRPRPRGHERTTREAAQQPQLQHRHRWSRSTRAFHGAVSQRLQPAAEWTESFSQVISLITVKWETTHRQYMLLRLLYSCTLWSACSYSKHLHSYVLSY